MDVQDFQLVQGAGVKGMLRVNSGAPQPAMFGSMEFAEQVLPEAQGLKVREVVSRVGDGKIVAVLAEGEGLAASWTVFCFEDGLQQNSANAVRELQLGAWKTGSRDGRFAQRVVMLTGGDLGWSTCCGGGYGNENDNNV